MPNGWAERFVRLDDREARARNFAVMTECRDESAGKGSLSDPEWTGKAYYVTGAHLPGQRSTRGGGLVLVRQDHRGERGIVSRTVVPFPLAESISTLPPCA